MRYLMASLVVLFALLAQELPDADNLMARRGSALTKLHSLQFTIERAAQLTSLGKRKTLTDTIAVAFVNPVSLRVESRGQMGHVILVSDDRGTTTYDFKENILRTIPAVMNFTGLVASMGLPQSPGAASVSMTSQTVGQEVIEMDGQKHDCWIVQNSSDSWTTPGSGGIYDPVWTLWLDKRLGIDLQSILSGEIEINGLMAHLEMKAVKKSLRIDAAIPNARFTFEAPPNASPVAGASDDVFVEQYLSGNKEPRLVEFPNLPNLDGRPLLVAFGTTWCQPCRQGMAALEKLYRETHDQGIEIVQVIDGESRAKIDDLLRMIPISYPIAGATSGKDMGIAVSGYPTYIAIGRDGTIVGNQTGFANSPGYDEAALRSMLMRAIHPNTETNKAGKKKGGKKK